MANAGQQVPRCAYPACENEPQPAQEGLTAEPAYCGLPDPVTGEPHTALTAFRRRQVLARPPGQPAGPEELDRPGFAAWRYRRASAQRRHQAEAEAAEARSAAWQADARLAESLAAKADAEQEAAAARVRASAARQAAEERVAAAQQERSDAVAEATSQATKAEQDAVRALEIARSARAELDRARMAADLQARKSREDAARDQAELRAVFEDQLAAAEDARAALQVRAERAEAKLQRVLADRDQAAQKAAAAPSPSPARRRQRPPDT
jgi:hypothetical protein